MTAWRAMARACWVTPNDQAAHSVPLLAARLQAHYLTWMLPFEDVRSPPLPNASGTHVLRLSFRVPGPLLWCSALVLHFHARLQCSSFWCSSQQRPFSIFLANHRIPPPPSPPAPPAPPLCPRRPACLLPASLRCLLECAMRTRPLRGIIRAAPLCTCRRPLPPLTCAHVDVSMRLMRNLCNLTRTHGRVWLSCVDLSWLEPPRVAAALRTTVCLD